MPALQHPRLRELSEFLDSVRAELSALVAGSARTLTAWKSVDGKALTTVIAPHPRFGPLNGYEWLLFIGKHEQRHLAQLRRVLGVA